MKCLRHLVVSCVIPCAAAAAHAQQPHLRGELPIDAYLDSLARIAPAARDGAEHYRQAFERRCARRLTTDELRRAVAERNGDPVLMGMIRAAAERDDAALQRLATMLSCPRRD